MSAPQLRAGPPPAATKSVPPAESVPPAVVPSARGIPAAGPAPSGPLAIEAEGLVRRFGDTVALDGLSLSAPVGTVLGVLGPNGAGKTTAVRVLTTLVRPESGWARVAGHDVVEDAHRVRARIALTGQFAAVDEDLSGQANLVLVARLLGMPGGGVARRSAARLLERFDLADVARERVKTYSGGMRRRLDLAASLLGRPEVIFLDEPTTGLDPRSRNDVWRMVRELADGGTTVLLTTQYLEEADRLADRIVVVDHGRIIEEGTPDELKSRVGGLSLRVRPADPDRTADVAAALAAVALAPPQQDRTELSAPVSGPHVLLRLVRELDDAGIVLAEMQLVRPSLDDVFLRLTDRPAADPTGSSS